MVHTRSDSWAPSLLLSLRISNPKGQKPNNHFETETYITHFGRIYRCRTQQPIHRIVGDIKINPRNSLPTSPHIVRWAFLKKRFFRHRGRPEGRGGRET